MSLEQEVATYGAKGAVLNYIRSNAPEIPIQPFILVPVGQDWREHEREINRLDDSLVRSSSPLEDGQEMSFAGLFETTQFSGQQSVDYVMASLTDENTLR
ncbi:hypothetical protein HYZ97_05100, partial [Candidatus Pacearchaeota archaeon]|nr:hypothetical protein [Candidatus Pacearchaeota archaeon]